MTDELYKKVRNRVERRLSKSPRRAIIHAVLFTGLSVPLGLLGIFTSPIAIMNGVLYWSIFFWSIFLFIHIAYVYFNSGAWQGRRERYVQEEVLDAGDTYELTEDELIDLHLKISEDIQQQSQPFGRLMFNAIGNLLLWPGVLVFTYLMYRTQTIPEAYFSPVFSLVILLALVGTLALGFTLPLKALRKEQGHDDLRAVYGYKRKRTPSDRLELTDDPGEEDIEVNMAELEVKKRTS